HPFVSDRKRRLSRLLDQEFKGGKALRHARPCTQARAEKHTRRSKVGNRTEASDPCPPCGERASDWRRQELRQRYEAHPAARTAWRAPRFPASGYGQAHA